MEQSSEPISPEQILHKLYEIEKLQPTKTVTIRLTMELLKQQREYYESQRCIKCYSKGYIRGASLDSWIDFCDCRIGQELRMAVLDFREHPILQYPPKI